MAIKKLPRNKLSDSAKYYRDHPKAAAKKAKTDTEINKRPEQMEKRRELGRIRTRAEKDGVDIGNRDYDHKTKSFVSIKTNRGRKNEGNR